MAGNPSLRREVADSAYLSDNDTHQTKTSGHISPTAITSEFAKDYDTEVTNSEADTPRTKL